MNLKEWSGTQEGERRANMAFEGSSRSARASSRRAAEVRVGVYRRVGLEGMTL